MIGLLVKYFAKVVYLYQSKMSLYKSDVEKIKQTEVGIAWNIEIIYAQIYTREVNVFNLDFFNHVFKNSAICFIFLVQVGTWTHLGNVKKSYRNLLITRGKLA